VGNHEGYVVLIKKPGDPLLYVPVEYLFSLGVLPNETQLLYGPVEYSFSLGVLPNETQYWWGALNYWGPGKHIDGLKRAQDSLDYWKKGHPDWEFKIWDLKDPMLPIIIDWALYEDAGQPAQTISGVKDKYHRRNLSFAMKTGHDFAASVAEATRDQAK
jgi:hypothetical protein